ncbi:MAG TPA: amidohydrolase family protein [Nitrososphaera sp.]|jgi:predicted TIM-barrel fold metal-dependent hydrolase|nr:amidohydrolase family protein [Nitrososphaera sp.]
MMNGKDENVNGNKMAISKLLSSDSHIIEPPDLWVTRIDEKYRHIAPRVERIDGTDWWIFEGKKIGSVSGRKKRSGGIKGAVAGVQSKGPVLTYSTFEDVRPAAYIPSEYVKENLEDGVVGCVIRPTQGITNYSINDPDLFGAICRAYNDWITEFCSFAPDMLKGMAMLNNYAPSEAVRELTRARKMGLVGGIISVYPGAEHSYQNKEYECLWSAAEEMNMPISLHVLSNYNGPYGVSFSDVTYSLRVNADYWVRMSLADMIFGGVFERHPKLHVETSEHEGGWIPYFLWQMDWTFEKRIRRRFQESLTKRRPSEYFRENIYVSFIYDPGVVEARYVISLDNIMWGSDYPHEQSTHPRSREIVSELMTGVPQHEVNAMTYNNTAQLFGFASLGEEH